MKELSGSLLASELRIGIVVSRFNELITERLLDGALSALRRQDISDDHVTVVHVPGSFEIPVAAQKLAKSEKCDAVICLGALIQGETDHYEYLSRFVTSAIGRVSLDLGVPIALGVITVKSVEQALNRSGIKQGNKGAEAALSAIEMANLFRRMD